MNQLTDVAQSSLASKPLNGPLKWVGMENMEAPLVGFGPSPTPAQVSAFVSLTKEDQKGIHMSRIYEVVQNLSQRGVTRAHLSKFLNEMTQSQKGSSDASKLILKANPLFERPALKSDKKGFKSYPVRIVAKNISGKESLSVSVIIEYSSTCPCSAALSREAIAEGFRNHFSSRSVSIDEVEKFLLYESTWPAWPHSQRSRACGTFMLNDKQQLPDFLSLIDQMERALATPTQTAVKRIDEKEFAKLNAQNLMFCEDAARRLKAAFQTSEFKDFKFWVRHFESLHSHDVYAESRK